MCRNTIDFCIITLYLEHWWVLVAFFWFGGFSMNTLISCVNKTSFTSPLFICMPFLFLFLFPPYCPARISSTMTLNKNGKNEQVWCIANSKKKTFSLIPKICFVLFCRCSLLNWESCLLFQVYWQISSKFTLDIVSYID